MRAGFRMPVNTSNTVKNLLGPQLAYTEDPLGEGFGSNPDSGDSAIIPGTNLEGYSELLANLDASAVKAGVTSITDVGPGGMSISISSAGATSPLQPRPLSSAAKSIRHAQGREDAAMLRPSHRKGMPGKSSERARNFVNKTWAPERFDVPSLGDMSPVATSMNIPRGKNVRDVAPASSSICAGDSKFQP
jgi:hypothetical protein